MRNLRFILILTLVFVADQLFAQGCSQCKLVAEQGSSLDEASFGSNINYGIIYLMIIPYVLLFFFFRKKIFSLIKGLIKK